MMITVILPCHNGAATLGEAVASVWAQHRNDLSIVAIDDASSDGTLALLHELKAESPIPMRVVANTENLLTAKSINQVYPTASEFITILHQDDVYPPERFDRQIGMMRADPRLQIVFANGLNFDANGVRGPLHDEDTKDLLSSTPKEIARYLCEHQSPIFLQPALIRRELFDRMSGLDEECVSDDWVTNIRIFSHLSGRHEFEYIDDHVYLRRKHAENFHRKQRTMTMLRMQVLEKYAQTPRRQEVLASYYHEQATYLIKHGFLAHAASMLALAAIWHRLGHEDTGRAKCMHELGGVLEDIGRRARDAAQSDANAHDRGAYDLQDHIERLLYVGPSLAGYRGLYMLLRDHGLDAESREIRAQVRGSRALRSMPRRPLGLPAFTQAPVRDERDDHRSTRSILSSAHITVRGMLPGARPAAFGAQWAAEALWEHYSLIEWLRYDLERRGVLE